MWRKSSPGTAHSSSLKRIYFFSSERTGFAARNSGVRRDSVTGKHIFYWSNASCFYNYFSGISFGTDFQLV
jgi:hypothetical protein